MKRRIRKRTRKQKWQDFRLNHGRKFDSIILLAIFIAITFFILSKVFKGM